jgi:hypothetical protein
MHFIITFIILVIIFNSLPAIFQAIGEIIKFLVGCAIVMFTFLVIMAMTGNFH